MRRKEPQLKTCEGVTATVDTFCKVVSYLITAEVGAAFGFMIAAFCHAASDGERDVGDERDDYH